MTPGTEELPTEMGALAEKLEALAEKFARGYMPEPNSGCWLWMGSCNQDGYGQIHYKGKNIRAHRVSYEMAKGSIPDHLQIDHLCRVRSCCNPDHLEAVTLKENTMRGIGPTALNAAKTHCAKGHPLDGDNLFSQQGRNGGRGCRTCQRKYNLEYYYRKKQANPIPNSDSKEEGR